MQVLWQAHYQHFLYNLSGRIHRIKCKFGHDDIKCETCGTKYKYFDCILEYKKFKDDLIECKCLRCNKNYQHKFDEKLKKQFFNTYKICNHNNNISLFRCCKSSMKYHYLILLMQITHTEKWFVICK